LPLPERPSLLSCLSTADIANFQFIFVADANNPFRAVVPFALVIAGMQVSATDLSKV
jgi:hypothetical protein